jgi:RimJ/RimL family protein N-acetyltransferase
LIAMRRLAGDGLRLEPQVAAHAAELFAVLNDPELYRYTDDDPPVSEAALRDRLIRLEARRSPDGGEQWLNWVVRVGDGRVAGYVQATIAQNGEAEIGYVIGRGFWRRGIGAEAVRTMLGELAAGYGVSGVTANVSATNAASLALLSKLGFRYLGEGAADGDVRHVRALDGAVR